MAQSRVDEQEREEIARKWVVEGMNIGEIQDAHDRSNDTVSHHIKRFLGIDDDTSLNAVDPSDYLHLFEEEEEPVQEEEPERWTGRPPAEVLEEPEPEPQRPEGPQDFIERHFQESRLGIKEDALFTIMDIVESRGELPDQREMRRLILELPSGISNDEQADLIAEIYWAKAQRYLGIRDPQGGQNTQPETQTSYPRGSYLGPPQQRSQPQQEQTPYPGPGDWHRPAHPPEPREQSPRQPEPASSQQAPADGSQGQPDTYEVGQRIQILEHRLDQIVNHLEQENGGQQGLTDLMEEALTVHDTIEQLRGQDQAPNEVNRLEQRMDELYRELQQVGQEHDLGQRAESLISVIATAQGMDAGEKAEIIQAVEGAKTDPEVAKEKFKLERSQTWANALIDAVGNVGQAVPGGEDGEGGGGIAASVGALLGGYRRAVRGPQQQYPQQPQYAQPPQQPQQPAGQQAQQPRSQGQPVQEQPQPVEQPQQESVVRKAGAGSYQPETKRMREERMQVREQQPEPEPEPVQEEPVVEEEPEEEEPATSTCAFCGKTFEGRDENHAQKRVLGHEATCPERPPEGEEGPDGVVNER